MNVGSKPLLLTGLVCFRLERLSNRAPIPQPKEEIPMRHTRSALSILSCCALCFVSSVLLFGTNVSAARTVVQTQKNIKGKADEPEALFHEYKGVGLGMQANDARKKLGSPAEKDDEQDFFIFSDTESAQVYYDKSHAVMALSVNYIGTGSGVPKAKDVLGTDIAVKPDGSMHELIRFPKAGYWLSYSRSAGDSPITTVTLKKLD